MVLLLYYDYSEYSDVSESFVSFPYRLQVGALEGNRVGRQDQVAVDRGRIDGVGDGACAVVGEDLYGRVVDDDGQVEGACLVGHSVNARKGLGHRGDSEVRREQIG